MVTERIENTILRNLLCNEEYYRKVVPHLDSEYFQDAVDVVLFEEIQDFSAKYDKTPTKEVLKINSDVSFTEWGEQKVKGLDRMIDIYEIKGK